jgi:transcriptional regulator with XRE-family HTH domain
VDDQYKKLPAALTAAREAAGLTQKELADKIGKTQQAVAKWENGESNPTRRSMGQLIGVLPDLARLGLPALAEHIRPNYLGMSPIDNLRRVTVQENRQLYGDPERDIPYLSKMEADFFDSLPPQFAQYRTAQSAFDYESPNLVLDLYAPLNMPGTGRVSLIASKLWQLSSAKIRNNDGRIYCLCLIIPSEDRNSYLMQRIVSRHITDAELHNVTLVVAHTPQEAAELTASIETQPTIQPYKNIYDDEDPHE